MSFPLNPVMKEELKAIYQDLGIDEERHQRSLEVFKDWIRCQPHLPDDIGDGYLFNFLAMCKDDLTKAKEKFEKNLIGRKSRPYLNYDSIIPINVIKDTNLSRTCFPSKKLTPEGYRVLYISLPDPKHFDQATHFKYSTMIVDRLMVGDPFSGIVAVADFINYTSELIPKMEVSLTMNLVHFFLQAVPQRMMHFHMVNMPSFAKPMITMAKAVMPEKLKKRILFHDKPENLLEYLPKDLLPVEYGGTMLNVEDLANEWLKYWEESADWKSRLCKLRLKGKIPKEKLHLDPSSGFGTDGTFRNIQVD